MPARSTSSDVALVVRRAGGSPGATFFTAVPEHRGTPTIVEAAAFNDAVVVVQANELVDEPPRADIPASRVDVVGGRRAVPDRAALHARPSPHHRRSDPDGDDDHPRNLPRTPWRHLAQPRRRFLTRPPSSSCSRRAGEKPRTTRQDRRHWVLNPHPDAHPRHRERAGERLLLRRRGGMNDCTRVLAPTSSTGHDGELAIEPRTRAARRTIRRRPVHRLDASDGRRRETRLPRHARSASRASRGAEHGAAAIPQQADDMRPTPGSPWPESGTRERPSYEVASSSSETIRRRSATRAVIRPFCRDAC